MAEFGKGSVIGNYRVVRTIGKGGMGTVYEVEHIELGTHYALKAFTFDPSDAVAAALKAKFLEEGRLLARLKHPNLTHVFDLGFEESTQTPYFVMDLVRYEDGGSYTVEDVELSDIDEDMVYSWFKQLASALDYIHGEGIVHRDIKPGNLLIDKDLNVILTDFGVSRIFGSRIRGEVDAAKTMVTKTGRGKLVLGTAQYIAPEVAKGREATPAADAYSLGVMLLRWLTGFYYGDNPGALSLLAGRKYRWSPVVSELLAPNPDMRPKTYMDLVRRLKPRPKVKPPSERKGSGVKVGLAAAVASLVLIGGYFAWRHAETKAAEEMQAQVEARRQMEEKAAAEKAERERLAAEQAKRKAAEQAKREAAERAKKEAAEKAERERIAAERAEREAEAKRLEAERKASEERRIAEEREKARIAAENAKKEAEAKRRAEEPERKSAETGKPAGKTMSAIPTEAEIKAVMPKIEELTQGDFSALRAKRKSHAETAEALLGYIVADDPVSTYVFRQMAFRQYVTGSDFGKAAGLYTALRNSSGIEYALSVASGMRSRIGGSTAKELKDRILADERSVKAIAAVKARLAKSPNNAKLREQLAFEYVACGDWESALFAFRNCGDEVAKVASWELDKDKNGDYDAVKVARFWWAFAERNAARRQIADVVKVHAADWYKKAIALNLLTGLDAQVAERRIEESESSGAVAIVKEERAKGLYMVIDLTKSGNRAIKYLDETPKDGWSDDFRTKKIVLRRIAPGSFEYMPGKSFKITKPFYIGVFEITQKQYEMTMKENPAQFKGDMRPVEKVSYIDIRGAKKGLNWPKDNAVDNDSYIGRMRRRYGFDFDLPTEVQWEYACRAGTTGDFNVDGVEMVKLGKCKDNGGETDNHVNVGSFLPNAWGLYDMHGNVWEWCLDRMTGQGWCDWTVDTKETDTDPKGSAAGTSRIHRGGCWNNDAFRCRSAQRIRFDAGHRNVHLGFRLSCSAATAR